jgi:hypothetical protein
MNIMRIKYTKTFIKHCNEWFYYFTNSSMEILKRLDNDIFCGDFKNLSLHNTIMQYISKSKGLNFLL